METDAPRPVQGHHVHQRHFERLIMLSDGVFAIAMTLSAVELKPDVQAGAGLLNAWLRPLATYFVSFAIISGVWIRHRSTLAHLRRVDMPMTLISLLLLSLVSLMPVVIRQMLEGDGEWSAVGLLIYALALMANYLCLAVGWGYAAFVAKLAPDVSRNRALVWLTRDLFVAVLFAAVALFSLKLKLAAAALTLVGVALRIGSVHFRKKAAQADEPEVSPGCSQSGTMRR
jgi:uncharacterized membrane protein